MKKVVIIGGGYGGLRAAEHLCKNKKLEITIIDKNPYHYMQTEAYGFIAGRFDMADIAINISAFVEGLSERVSFLLESAISIDKETQAVALKSGEMVHYDYLIVAVGAVTNFFPFIKGAREFTYGVKNIDRVVGFRQEFEERLYKKLQNVTFDKPGDLHIAIAGAGLSGVEIAAEMAYMLKTYHKILCHQNADFEISLIDAADTILPGSDPYIIKHTENRLKELGIKIYTKSFIDEIKERGLTFKDGTSLDFDFMIYTAGIKGPEFLKSLDTKTNRQEQVITDSYLRLQDMDNIFVIGDCAQTVDKNNNILPPTAQIAEKAAAYVATVINNLEEDIPLKPFDAKMDGIFVALGGDYAVGVLYDKIKVKGYFAYLLKKVITRTYRLGLEFKVNVGFKKRAVDH